MVQVEKRDGRLEEFKKSKIIVGCKKAGATAIEATKVATEVSKKVAKMVIVPATKLSNMVVASLKKINKTAASEFVKFKNEKFKKKYKYRSWLK